MALKEIYRILKSEGKLFITTTQCHGLHQEPHNYYNYLSYGLEYILKKNNFHIIELKPLGGIYHLLGKIIHNIIEKTDRPLIIFPQGTRVNPEERPIFKKGVARIYEELKISCQPVAINSGHVWPKKGNKKSNGKIIISILPKIDNNLDKNQFLNKLQETIYSELDKIN